MIAGFFQFLDCICFDTDATHSVEHWAVSCPFYGTPREPEPRPCGIAQLRKRPERKLSKAEARAECMEPFRSRGRFAPQVHIQRR